MSLAIEIVSAVATTSAVVVALWLGRRSLAVAQRGVRIDGRRQAAIEVAAWAQAAETSVLAWHDPRNWVVSDMEGFGAASGVRSGELLPPSQGRMGPSLESTIRQFDPIRGLTRLSFGPEHDVAALVSRVTQAIQQVADRGVIFAAEDGPTPRDYVDNTFLPLVAELFESLAEACDLR